MGQAHAWGLIGHDWAIDLLQRGLATGHLAHAYLFLGPPGIGKTTLALVLARVLNCAGQERPCGECLPCRRILRGVHTDVRLIQPEAERGSEGGPGPAAKLIKIDQVRDLQRDAALAPYEGRYKVYIIRNAEDLGEEAANCLLKTLEEPPPQVVLILTALDANMLLPTVVSRCQALSLRPAPVGLVQEHLQRRYGSEETEARRLAHLSEGRVGWAVRLADKQAQEEYESLRSRLMDLMEAGEGERLAFAAELAGQFARNRAVTDEPLRVWASLWRDLLLVQLGGEGLVTHIDKLPWLRHRASGYGLGPLRAYLADIRTTVQHLARNVNPRLALEVLMLNMPTAGEEGFSSP